MRPKIGLSSGRRSPSGRPARLLVEESKNCSAAWFTKEKQSASSITKRGTARAARIDAWSGGPPGAERRAMRSEPCAIKPPPHLEDRKSVVPGKSVSVREDLGGG